MMLNRTQGPELSDVDFGVLCSLKGCYWKQKLRSFFWLSICVLTPCLVYLFVACWEYAILFMFFGNCCFNYFYTRFQEVGKTSSELHGNTALYTDVFLYLYPVFPNSPHGSALCSCALYCTHIPAQQVMQSTKHSDGWLHSVSTLETDVTTHTPHVKSISRPFINNKPHQRFGKMIKID